jgi:hypothetical protein
MTFSVEVKAAAAAAFSLLRLSALRFLSRSILFSLLVCFLSSPPSCFLAVPDRNPPICYQKVIGIEIGIIGTVRTNIIPCIQNND